MKSRIMNIAFVGRNGPLPIPAVKGGAIQTLVTALMDQNEIEKQCVFDVFTTYDILLDDVVGKYNYSNIISFKKKQFDSLYDYIWKAIRKLSGRRIESRSAFMKRVNRKVSSKKYDFIIFESTEREVREFKYAKEIPVLFHVHADYLDSDILQTMELINKCFKIITVSDFIAKQISKGKIDDKTVTLKNAVDISCYGKNEYKNQRKQIREKYGINENDKVIIYCSRLSPEKGVLELVQAISKVPSCKLMIVGGENFSSDKETPYTQKLKETVNKIRDRVIFTGYVSHDQVPFYLFSADIGAIPSVCNEAAPLTLLEMRASNLPLVVSNRGGIPEYCCNENAIIVDTDSDFVENLAIAINKICENDCLFNSLKQHSQDGIDQFGYDNFYDRFIKMLFDLKEEYIDGDILCR